MTVDLSSRIGAFLAAQDDTKAVKVRIIDKNLRITSNRGFAQSSTCTDIIRFHSACVKCTATLPRRHANAQSRSADSDGRSCSSAVSLIEPFHCSNPEGTQRID